MAQSTSHQVSSSRLGTVSEQLDHYLTVVQLTSANMASAMPHPHASGNRSRLFTAYNFFGLCGNMMLVKFNTIKKLCNIKTKIIT